LVQLRIAPQNPKTPAINISNLKIILILMMIVKWQ